MLIAQSPQYPVSTVDAMEQEYRIALSEKIDQIYRVALAQQDDGFSEVMALLQPMTHLERMMVLDEVANLHVFAARNVRMAIEELERKKRRNYTVAIVLGLLGAGTAVGLTMYAVRR